MMAVQINGGRAVSCELTVSPGLPTGLESAHAQYYPRPGWDIRFTGDDLMAISKRLRFEILRRDNHCCRYCGEHASPQVKLTIDHVMPTALGGNDDPSNLAAACGPCNAGKSASSPDAPIVAQVAEDAMRWANAVRAAFDRQVLDYRDQDLYCEYIADHWLYSTQDDDHSPAWERLYLPPDWETSIRGFHSRGMPIQMLERAANVALNRPWMSSPKSRWKYFMGTAWKMLEQVEAEAKTAVHYGS